MNLDTLRTIGGRPMELQTRKFGPVTFEKHELIDLVGVESCLSQCLLLADKTHPDLYWLQSAVDGAEAIPVCSLGEFLNGARSLRVSRSQAWPDWNRTTSFVVFVEIRDEPSGVSLDLQHPILIDSCAHRGAPRRD